MVKTRVATVGKAFYESFLSMIPDLKFISSPEEVANYDLLILTGGEDVNPMMYGQKNTYSYSPNTSRDSLETEVIRAAMSCKAKIFGACRGLQILNVVLGGTLYQDIRQECGSYHEAMHPIVYRDSLSYQSLQKFFPNNGLVNSYHHQGISHLAQWGRCRIIAEYLGVPEIVSFGSAPGKELALAVQFHPEWMDNTEKFFEWLVEDWAKR